MIKYLALKKIENVIEYIWYKVWVKHVDKHFVTNDILL